MCFILLNYGTFTKSLLGYKALGSAPPCEGSGFAVRPSELRAQARELILPRLQVGVAGEGHCQRGLQEGAAFEQFGRARGAFTWWKSGEGLFHAEEGAWRNVLGA